MMTEGAVTTAVDFLLPRSSCSRDRWLTFDFEAESKTGEKFSWLAQYSATSNYVSWRTVLKDGVVHVLVLDRWSSEVPTPWVPALSLPQNQVRLFDSVAPGFVISDGCHDSCWKDHALKLQGYPYVPDGTWTDEHGEHKKVTPTRYFSIFHDTTVRVNGISLKGPVISGSHLACFKEEFQKRVLSFEDGEWVNNTTDLAGLVGCWAIFHGMSKLAHCVGKDVVEIRLDGRFSCGEWGKDHRQKYACVHYRFKDGFVTHIGVLDDRNSFFVKGWREVAPFLLDEHRFWFDAGFSDRQISGGKWRIDNLFSDVKND